MKVRNRSYLQVSGAIQNRRQKVVIRRDYVRAGGGLTFKFDKNSIDLLCFIFQIGEAWSFVWVG